MKQDLSFRRAQTIVKCLLAVAGVMCAAALLLEGGGVTGFSMYAVVVAVVCIILTFLVVAGAMKCPYCGRRIIRKCLVVKVCPHCSRDLSSGIRVKGKKAKR